jgi:hypothetical protein
VNRADYEQAVRGVDNHDDAASLHLELAHEQHATTNAQHRRQMGVLSDELEQRHPGSRRKAAVSTYEELRGDATGVGSQRRAHQSLRTQLGISNDQAALERRRQSSGAGHGGRKRRATAKSSPRPTLDHPRVPPRPAQQRRRAPSLSLPSIPTGGLGDVTGGASDFAWAIATGIVGLSLLYLLLGRNGSRGFSTLLDGVTTGVRLVVEPVDPLGGAGALNTRKQIMRDAAAHPASRPVGTTPLGQAHNPTRGT